MAIVSPHLMAHGEDEAAVIDGARSAIDADGVGLRRGNGAAGGVGDPVAGAFENDAVLCSGDPAAGQIGDQPVRGVSSFAPENDAGGREGGSVVNQARIGDGPTITAGPVSAPPTMGSTEPLPSAPLTLAMMVPVTVTGLLPTASVMPPLLPEMYGS